MKLYTIEYNANYQWFVSCDGQKVSECQGGFQYSPDSETMTDSFANDSSASFAAKQLAYDYSTSKVDSVGMYDGTELINGLM
jgi:hypothetical protein